MCGCEICILATSLQASLNEWILRHIICLEHLAESRGHTRPSGVFHEQLMAYRGYVYPNGFNIHKNQSDYSLSKLCTYIDSNIEFTK